MTRDEQRAQRRAKAERMAAMFRQGLTLQQIGDEYGITRERVRQLIKQIGQQDARRETMAQMREVRAKSKQAKREARIYAKWGVDPQLHAELRRNGTVRRYEQQRKNAQYRGIGWELTFAEWYAIWQASGKLHLCGRGLGHYCMSRIRDTGPYAVGNVHIQTAQENSREAVKKWRGKTKKYKGVFLLYPGVARGWLAKVGDVSVGYFESAEEAHEARLKYMAERGIKPGGIGRGKGWTLCRGLKTRPYLMQCGPLKSYHATQEEAEQAYREAVAQLQSEREATHG